MRTIKLTAFYAEERTAYIQTNFRYKTVREIILFILFYAEEYFFLDVSLGGLEIARILSTAFASDVHIVKKEDLHRESKYIASLKIDLYDVREKACPNANKFLYSGIKKYLTEELHNEIEKALVQRDRAKDLYYEPSYTQFSYFEKLGVHAYFKICKTDK